MDFATVLTCFFIAHYTADYLLQTDRTATHKAEPGWTGWAWNLRHGAEHVAAAVLLPGAVWLATGQLGWSWTAILAGAGFIGGTHMFIDRRWPVRWVLRHTGSPQFAELTAPVHGMTLADQALHLIVLLPASLLVTGLSSS